MVKIFFEISIVSIPWAKSRINSKRDTMWIMMSRECEGWIDDLTCIRVHIPYFCSHPEIKIYNQIIVSYKDALTGVPLKSLSCHFHFHQESLCLIRTWLLYDCVEVELSYQYYSIFGLYIRQLLITHKDNQLLRRQWQEHYRLLRPYRSPVFWNWTILVWIFKNAEQIVWINYHKY